MTFQLYPDEPEFGEITLLFKDYKLVKDLKDGWNEIDGEWYYVYEEGLHRTDQKNSPNIVKGFAHGLKDIHGKKYFFHTSDCYMLQDVWISVGDGKEYYASSDGSLAINGLYNVHGAPLYFDENGICTTQYYASDNAIFILYKVPPTFYYYNSSFRINNLYFAKPIYNFDAVSINGEIQRLDYSSGSSRSLWFAYKIYDSTLNKVVGSGDIRSEAAIEYGEVAEFHNDIGSSKEKFDSGVYYVELLNSN